jgi:serine/threonine-protein kinase ATR
MLQAQQRKPRYSFIESARLLKATGEPLRALNELESSSTLLGLFNDQVLDLTADAESDRMKAKVCVFGLYLAVL